MLFFLILTFFALIPSHILAAEESITLTTYYPSPYGVYGEMRLYPKSSPNSPCQEGTMYYDSDAGEKGLKVCDASGNPQPIGGGYWAAGSVLNSIYNTNPGNVGIGTASPATALDVKGTLTIRAPDDGVGGTLSSVSTSGALVYAPAGSGGYSSVHIFKNRSGNDIMLLDGTGNVGIGIDGPASLLELYKTNASPGLTLTAATSTTSYDPYIAFRTGATPLTQAVLGIDYSDSNKLKFVRGSNIASSTGMTIDSGGNIGIGTTNPDSKLVVMSDNAGGVDRANQLVVKGLSNQNLKLNMGIHTEASPPFADIGFVEEAVAWRDLVLAKNGGNVGIGTASPTQKLDVNGKARFRSGIQMGGGQWTTTCSGTPPISCSNTTTAGTRYDFCALSWTGGRDGAECEIIDLGGGQWRLDGRNSFGTTVKCGMRCFNYY